MNTIADYMTADTKSHPYLPYPRFLLGADLMQTAKVLYAVLLDRSNLSRANGWTDEDRNITECLSDGGRGCRAAS